jgi:hypothetical protein
VKRTTLRKQTSSTLKERYTPLLRLAVAHRRTYLIFSRISKKTFLDIRCWAKERLWSSSATPLGIRKRRKKNFLAWYSPLQNFVYLELYTKSPGFGAGKGGSRSLIYLGLQEGNNFRGCCAALMAYSVPERCSLVLVFV